ncbi:WYL domain-containing protein [Nocardioides zeae]|uniref:WYL domain-containing protein n=1 Tax=Nocardioides imazamoxiresistens TaxID=3231893 RepID=A0ABU3PWE5_9ACTN|nr:WYL domain-containing protein [Nocardioides zeae]MDT9593521.1 WYL domain-containing protein [Nocardioides zeae]
MASTSARMLRLLSLLQTHRFWTGMELSERLEVSDRTLRRDVERLRELGYPVEAMRGHAGGYQLQAGAALPPLLVEDDEAVAIALALRAAASGAVAGLEESALRALTKVVPVMPPKLRRRMDAIATQTTQAPRRGPALDATVLTRLAQCCRDDERLRFAYAARRSTVEGAPLPRRHVEPHSLVTIGQRWYLVAWDLDRRDWRTFRVDRISDADPSRVRFAPRSLPDGLDALAFVRRSTESAPRAYDVRVLVHADATTVARHVMTWGRVDPVEPDPTTGGPRCRLTTSADWLDGPLWLLGEIDADFVVESPPELVERVRRVGERYARAAATT